MTKKLTLLTLLAAFLLPFGAKAQDSPITQFPYTQGFENGLDGWTVIDDDNDGYTWTLTTASEDLPAHGGSQFIWSGSYINNVGALTPDNWLVSPAITLNNSEMILSWWNRVQDHNFYWDHYAVYVSTTGNTVADFTDEPIFEYTITSSESDWTKHTVSLADYAGETVHIAFRHFNSTDVYIFHIDDISIDAPATCTDPQDLEASDITTTGATLTWTAAATATATIMTINGDTVENVTGSSHSFTNLNPGTTYTVTVSTICGGDTTDMASVIFHTLCNTFELPWFDGFEVEESLNCWNRARGVSRAYYQASTVDGTGILLFESSAGAAADVVVFTPAIVLPADAEGLQLEYYVAGSSNSTYEVLISPDASTDPDGALDTLLLDTVGGSYTHRIVSLDDYAGQTVTIAFHMTTASLQSTSLYMDNVGIRNSSAPLVTLPSSAIADANLAATFSAIIEDGVLEGITYSWTSAMEAAGNATMTATDSILSITYTTGGEDTITVTATNSYGSGIATMYVHVRNCQAIDSLPWFEGFSNAADLECWTVLDLDGNGTSWTLNSNGYLYGQYNSGGPDDWVITPAVAVPEEADGLVLGWSVYGDVYMGLPNNYQVLVSPTAGTTATSFTDTLFAESYPTTVWASRTAAISQYAGQTVRFAFRHVNTGDDNGMRIDSVNIRLSLAPMAAINGPAANNIGDTAVFTASLIEGATDGLTYVFSSKAVTAGIASDDFDSNIYRVVYTTPGIDTITLVATNSFGVDTVTHIVNVRDLNPANLPYLTGFEANEDTAWTFLNGSNGWYLGTAASTADTNDTAAGHTIYISADSGATNSYTVSGAPSYSYAYRALRFNQAGEYSISYDWRAQGETNYDYIRVFLAPATVELVADAELSGLGTTTTPANCIALDGGSKLNLSAAWQTKELTFDLETAGTYLLVFYWRNDNSVGNPPPAAIDNINVAQLTCPRPSNFTVDATSADTIAFHWSPRGDETSWAITISTDSAVVVNNEVVLDTIYLIDGLEANTEYNVQIRAICGEGDTSFSLNNTVRTECDAISLPYFESFETGGELCWNIHSYYPSGAASTALNTVYHVSGTHCYRFYPGYNYQPVFAVLPHMTDVNTLMMTFNVCGSSYGTVVVGTMANMTDTSTFVPLYSIMSGLNSTMAEHEVRFNADTTGNEYIAFRFGVNSSWGWSIYLDDVNVMVAPSCARPEGVSVSNITANGADVHIADTTGVNNYRVVVISGTDTVIDAMATDTLYTLTGLEANTNYTVIVNAVCDDGTSTNIRSTSFRTDCEGGSCEFTVAMVDSWGDGWNGNAIKVWQNGEVYETLTIPDGNNNTVTVRPCLGDPVALIWQSGNYPNETSFSIIDANDTTLLAASGSDYMTGDTIIIFDGACNATIPVHNDTIPEDTTSACNAPAIVAATPTQTTITLVWTGTAAEYEVAIVAGAWQAPATGTATTAHNYVFQNLTAATQYTVGVRAICDDTTSNWVTRSVTTQQASDTNSIDQAAQLSFSLYPNPASGMVSVEADGHVLVAVLDLNGREVLRTEQKHFDVSDLAKGAYFVRVTTEDGIAVRKLIVR